MKISTRWLLTFLPEQISTDNLINLLNRAGLTVESTSLTGCTDPNIIIAQILSSQKHPNADRLSICSVDDGSGQNRQIVCGASNYKVGDKVPLALPGATLPTGVKIKASNIRGVRSEGMLCSAAELALQDISDGLLILPPDAPIGSSFASFLPPDTILEIEVTPNRPDCLSYLGIARELAAFLDTKVIFTYPTLPFTTPNSEIAQIHTSSNCSFYTLRRIRGVRIAPSPLWLQRRLEASGIRPINNVVDVTNYVLLELGQPLHAFDALKLNPPISIRSANSSERFLALNGCEYTLTSSDTVIADQSNILAIGGVIGGESSAISDSTSEIWIESALFNPSSIRATSRRLGISTESSYRFERGVDPNAVILASTRATQLILELAGGQADDNIIVCGQLPNPPNPILLHHNYVNKLLGHIFSDTDIHNILSRICSPVLSQTSSNTSTWLPPSWRLDLKTQTDLCEEICRLTGIESIPNRLIAHPSPTSSNDLFFDFTINIRNLLASHGLYEIKTSSLIPQNDANLFLSHFTTSEPIRLRNPLGEDHSFLRPSLLPGLLRCANSNSHNGAQSIPLFEIGTTYGGSPEESSSLAILLSGPSSTQSWLSNNPPPYSFFWLKGLLNHIFDNKIHFEPFSSPNSQFIVATHIHCGNSLCGFAGILSPSFAEKYDLHYEVILAEISLDKLATHFIHQTRKFQPFPKFPSVNRDLAIVVDKNVAFSSIYSTIKNLKDPLLAKIHLFDVFFDPSGQKLPPNKKSIAISLTFLSNQRTLTSTEVEQSFNRIKQALANSLQASFREPNPNP